MSSTPALSLIVPVHNRRRYLRTAVESALREKVEGLEILVVDDGSTDGSLDTIQGLPVTCLRLASRRRGVAVARNAGICEARGSIIGFLDSDDVLAEGGLRRRLTALAESPAESAVGGCIAGIVDGEGRLLGSADEVLFGRPVAAPPFLTWEFFAGGGFFPVPLWLYLFRREFLERLGPLDESLNIADDLDLLLRAVRVQPIPVLPAPVAYYRAHDAQLSKQSLSSGITWSSRTKAEWLLVRRSHGLQDALCAAT